MSLYGLNAAEAVMMLGKTSDGAVPRALLAKDRYISGTWSGPSGWAKTANRLRLTGNRHLLTWTLWFALAIPSLLVFVSLPLSGLALEMETGYIRRLSVSGPEPHVTGFSYANFNERYPLEIKMDTIRLWRSMVLPRIPKMGIIYSRPGAARLAPGTLPIDAGVSEIFLTAQADTPIEGAAWGMKLSYDCVIADSLSYFTVLTSVNESQLSSGDEANQVIFKTPDITKHFITMTNVTQSYLSRYFTVISHGFKIPPDLEHNMLSTMCYFNGPSNATGDYHDTDQESILEIVLWQFMFGTTSNFTDKRPQYNTTIGHNMTDLYGVYSIRPNLDHHGLVDQYDLIYGKGDGITAYPMSAIGLRCSSSVSLGSTRINGTTSTYTDFVRTDTPITDPFKCADRLNGAQIGGVCRMAFVPLASGTQWATELLDSHVGPPETFLTDSGERESIRQSYLQPEHLRKSILRMYYSYAIHLMYGN